MPESAATPATALSEPDNPAVAESGSESADAMPEDQSAPLEPDQQAPDSRIPEPDQEPATDDEAGDTDSEDETEAPESEDDQDTADDVQQEATPAAPAEQVTKIVIWVRKGMATVGVQEAGTDPEFGTVASHDLDEVMPAVIGIVRAAQEKWLTDPQRKLASPAPALATGPRPASATRRAASSRNASQTTPQLF